MSEWQTPQNANCNKKSTFILCQNGKHHKMPTVINNKHIYIMSEWQTPENANCNKQQTHLYYVRMADTTKCQL